MKITLLHCMVCVLVLLIFYDLFYIHQKKNISSSPSMHQKVSGESNHMIQPSADESIPTLVPSDEPQRLLELTYVDSTNTNEVQINDVKEPAQYIVPSSTPISQPRNRIYMMKTLSSLEHVIDLDQVVSKIPKQNCDEIINEIQLGNFILDQPKHQPLYQEIGQKRVEFIASDPTKSTPYVVLGKLCMYYSLSLINEYDWLRPILFSAISQMIHSQLSRLSDIQRSIGWNPEEVDYSLEQTSEYLSDMINHFTDKEEKHYISIVNELLCSPLSDFLCHQIVVTISQTVEKEVFYEFVGKLEWRIMKELAHSTTFCEQLDNIQSDYFVRI